MSLQEKLTELATELEVPGVVAGVVHGETTDTAVHGVTNLDHPLPVDDDTLFQFGSTGKTLTATALVVLSERGLVDLEAPVRTYLPDLQLADEDVAAKVTVLQLLNHTAGWSGDVLKDTGDGDDCLARFVDQMKDLQQVSPLGNEVSYNNASLSLAGHVLATVHGTTYEQAVRELVLQPLELNRTFAFPKEIMTFRFASGHQRSDAGEVAVVRPWALPRSGAPAGGWTATIGDQLTWARFHLGLTSSDLLSTEARESMQRPTALSPGNALGDAVGISWLLEDLQGRLAVKHGGTTIGQHSDFFLLPEEGFGFVCMTNCGPTGAELYGKLREWALETYLGITTVPPAIAELSDEELSAYEGTYVSAVADAQIRARQGRLVVSVTVTDRSVLSEDEPAELPDIVLGVLEDDADRYVVAEGDAKGLRGFFTRNDGGQVDGINFSGRHMTKA